MGSAGVAAVPALPKVPVHSLEAGPVGGTEHFPTLGHGALAHRYNQKDSQKCSKHFNCLDSATKYKRWLWSFMERCM